ncbi:anaerobic ribonucleoside-triphosphate reductase, partial [Anaerotignum sp.]
CRDGYIYIHDMSARRDTMNCCLFDVKTVLTGGFEMGNLWYNEPKTLEVAFDVIGDIVLSAASQQYGGFTVPSVDLLLEPFAEKSYEKYYRRYIDLGLTARVADRETMKDIQKDFDQGFQGWEYKFNTVASSRGDYPFITMTFGTGTGKFAKMASISMLNVRRKGQGKKTCKKPVLFPKLVFLYDENLHGPGKELEDVFEAGILCSSKSMYPDWLSLTGEGYVAEMYKKYGAIISPMGCRAFLSPWYEKGGMEPADENDKPVFVGRFNIGAVSLHLPMIYAKAKQENKPFFEVLDYYLELIRQLHIRTYAYLGEMRASTNPLAYCEGGFYGGHLNFHDKIKPLLKTATASFGITALNELQELYNGKSLVEDGEFAIETLKHINEKIAEFKKADGNLYAIYGTPAESLCGLQVTQFRKKFGVVEHVSDRPYVSNSFHCHVTEDITPIEKQDLEKRFWDLSNGGKIQYVKYPIDYNLDAIRTLVRRAMKMGFYEGVNLSLAYCDDCGHQELEMDTCPKCGSSNLTKIDRMNGYLSYSRVKGDSRLNDAKMAEIAERKSM